MAKKWLKTLLKGLKPLLKCTKKQEAKDRNKLLFLECKEVDCEGISAEGRTALHGLCRKGWNHDQIYRAQLLKVERQGGPAGAGNGE